jgi:hypothetical protein
VESELLSTVQSSGRKNVFHIIHNTRNSERKYTIHYNEEDKTAEMRAELTN